MYHAPSRPKQMVVKVGSGAGAPSSSNKGAERSGVKAGRHDAAVSHDASVRSMRPSLQLERPHNPRHQISS